MIEIREKDIVFKLDIKCEIYANKNKISNIIAIQFYIIIHDAFWYLQTQVFCTMYIGGPQALIDEPLKFEPINPLNFDSFCNIMLSF